MTRVRGRAALPVLGRVFLSLGVVMLVVASVFAGIRASALSGALRGEGSVVSLRSNGRSYVPVVEFTPEGGKPVRFESPVGSNPPAYRVGDHVGVRYVADRPGDALIDSYWHLWFFPTLFGILGTPFLLAGAIMRVIGRGS